MEDYQEDIAEYRRLLKIMHLREDDLAKKLEKIYWQPAQSYIDGFRMGAKIMIDIYQKDYTEFAD